MSEEKGDAGNLTLTTLWKGEAMQGSEHVAPYCYVFYFLNKFLFKGQRVRFVCLLYIHGKDRFGVEEIAVFIAIWTAKT